ncbi:MAG: hypothetical protein PVG22_15825 [Chromatiales bacterium]|jgi:hypothetical protein
METITIDVAINLLLGVTVLLVGRNIFWLFVAVIGFMFGIEIAQGLFFEQPMWMSLLAGVGMGLVGAVVAIVYQRLAFVLAGFYAGVFLTIVIAGELGLVAMPAVTPFFIGLLGAVLAFLMTDWAIILLSSLAGAALIVTTLSTLQSGIAMASFLVLAVVGMFVQWNILTRQRRSDAPSETNRLH